MNREQMIAHFTIGGWTPSKFRDHFALVFRGPEACIYVIRSGRGEHLVKHIDSAWCDDSNKHYICAWSDLTDRQLEQLFHIESGGEGVIYEP